MSEIVSVILLALGICVIIGLGMWAIERHHTILIVILCLVFIRITLVVLTHRPRE